MGYQAVFRRYELKYLITPAQRDAVLGAMAPHMVPDPYGRTTVRNIYYDTPDCRLIRRSLEKPVYKEKLRLRSYQRVAPGGEVFAELKKKYDHVVYKRRLSLGEAEALDWLSGKKHCADDSQIAREIDYFLSFYRDLRPRVFLSYEREAYHSGDFRVTFDENILCRLDELSLEAEVGGTPILPEGRILMEIKCTGGIPLWMTRVLTRERIFRTSFSKYGTIAISESYEGLEGLHIAVCGGEISLISSDDGINAAGGNDASGMGGRDQFGGPGGMGNSDGTIAISGGSIYMEASGDGIDANGSLEITGGCTIVTGPTQGDTATLDYDISATISGGTFIGTGSSMMAQTFSENSQGIIAVSLGGAAPAGTELVLTDADGSEVVRFTPNLSYAVVILSTPEMVSGDSYTITIGTASAEFEAY